MTAEKRLPRHKPSEESRAATMHKLDEFLRSSPPGSLAFNAFTDQMQTLEAGLALSDALMNRRHEPIQRAAEQYGKLRVIATAQMRGLEYRNARLTGLHLLNERFGKGGIFNDSTSSNDPEIRKEIEDIIAEFKGAAIHMHGQEKVSAAFDWYKTFLSS